MITYSAKESGQQKEQQDWGLEVTGEWEDGVGWKKTEKEKVGNIEWVFIKLGGQHPSANYVKRL